MEEYIKKLMFVDSLVIFDQVTELSGPLPEQKGSKASYIFTKVVRAVINLPQYFAIVEFDLRKYTTTAIKYLEWFRRSLETSVAFSSLLAGVLTTIAMLVVVVLRGAV
ncbi:MAG: hypothetical protein QXG17_06810 [Sulfolobales archaeon]